MDRAAAEQAVLVSAVVVSGVWGYRKLVEPIVAGEATEPNTIKQLIGLEPKPAPTSKFLVGFGFAFMALSIAAIGAPDIAGAFAILIATGSVLANGASLFTDISQQTTTTTKKTAVKPAAKKAGA